MGMGLSICRSIIEAHGERVWATENLPKGAAFQFTLPQAPGLWALQQSTVANTHPDKGAIDTKNAESLVLVGLWIMLACPTCS
jgi:hypothetical protein